MYVSAERLAIADREVMETFAQTSIAWQAIPSWNIGDPGAARVRNDVVNAPNFLDVDLDDDRFQATLAQLGAPTPDSLLAEVMASSAQLAAKVDKRVLDKLQTDPPIIANAVNFAATMLPEDIMDGLIDARAKVENAGYRAPCCLITNTQGLKKLNAFSGGYPVTDSILRVANVNSLNRASQLDKTVNLKGKDVAKVVMILLGRRQRIADGAAAGASSGEEPVDLAVSVLPSLELVGEDPTRDIEMASRIRYATRIKDPSGVVLLQEP